MNKSNFIYDKSNIIITVKNNITYIDSINNKYVTFEEAKKIITDNNIKTKYGYKELCTKHQRLPSEPDIFYKTQFIDWIDYLSIVRKYYDLDTCIKRVNELLLLYKDLKKYYLDLSLACKELCKLDINFPPCDLWSEYYNEDLHKIIKINIRLPKKSTIIDL